MKQRLARIRRAVARFAVRYGTIGVSLLVAVVAVGIAGLTLTVAPDNVKETWTQRLAIVIGGWSVAGGGIWLGDYLWHKIKGVHQVLSRKERELNRQEGREEGLQVGRDEGRQEERQEWQGWYSRMRQAEQSGRPFDEPPPGGEPGRG